MKYILDTDIISLMFRANTNIKKKVDRWHDDISTTIVNSAEIHYGLHKKYPAGSALSEKIQRFLNEIEQFTLEQESVHIYAKIKANLEKNGKRLEDMDLLIAAICMAHNAILITHNLKHFQRIRGLRVEDWS